MQRTNPKHILLVDDNLQRCGAIARILSSAGYSVRTAHSAEEGLDLIDRQPAPDLVLMDVRLPGISGLEACRRICSDRRRKPMLILRISSVAVSSTERAKGLEAGAVDYVAWPISSRELKARVSAVLGTNRPAVKEGKLDLSPRQLEVVAWIAEGLTTKEVAAKLGVTVRTAETHRAAILRRLGFHSTAQLVRFAIERGVTTDSLGLR
jgi:DNA-binding NarL/FixJ family response regulator